MTATPASSAFCDSAAALEAARADGLDPDLEILTVSPFLQYAASGRFTFLPDRLSSRDMNRILSWRRELQIDAFERASAEDEIAEFAHLAAFTALRALDLVLLASFLGKRDFEEPRLIVHVDLGDAFAHSQFNGPWKELLAENTDCSLRSYHMPSRPIEWDVVPHDSLLERMRVASWHRILYRLIRKTGLRIPRFFCPEAPDVLVLNENELVQETAAALAMRGCALRFLPSPPTAGSIPSAAGEKLRHLCEMVFAKRIEGHVVRPAQKPLLRMIGDRLVEDAKQQLGAKAYYEGFLSAGGRQDQVVITNFPAKPALMAIRNLCREKAIPFLGFQHSVSTEVCEDHDSTFSTYEAWNCDRAYVFNERAVEIAKKLPSPHGPAVSVGLPNDFSRTGGPRPRGAEAAPILFVSTAAYCGYFGKIRYGTQTDRDMLELEMAIISKVLCGLPHKVLYKSYPASRFLDDDPAVALAGQCSNITNYTDFLDLRYLIRSARVLVTSRATSTVSWCALSERPLVFIDVADNMPLRSDARDAFQEGTFLFSTADAEWTARLKAFLSRPIAEIEDEWEEKREGRRSLISGYMGSGTAAGRRAAESILSLQRDPHAATDWAEA